MDQNYDDEISLYYKGSLNTFVNLEKFSSLKTREQNLILIRGAFDSSVECDISVKTLLNNNLVVYLCFLCKNLSKEQNNLVLDNIYNFFLHENVNGELNKARGFIRYENINALEFLDKIYYNADNRCVKKEKYNTYLEWLTFGFGTTQIPRCKVLKHDELAILPTKHRISDVGYDLTIIKLVKQLGEKTFMYDTGISIQPELGYYTKIVPRSSLVKSGYMLTNSMGIIDPAYTGTLKIVLTKVDDSFPDLKLPYKCCQLIIDRNIHYVFDEVHSEKELLTTSRADGGFGSTN